MEKPSFWERVGRGLGYGLQKAKELGSDVSDKIEGRLELEKAREALDSLHLQLGKLAAKHLAEQEAGAFTADFPPAAELLEAITRQEKEVERLEEERSREEAAREKEAAREEEAAGGAAGPPRDPPETPGADA